MRAYQQARVRKLGRYVRIFPRFDHYLSRPGCIKVEIFGEPYIRECLLIIGQFRVVQNKKGKTKQNRKRKEKKNKKRKKQNKSRKTHKITKMLTHTAEAENLQIIPLNLNSPLLFFAQSVETNVFSSLCSQTIWDSGTQLKIKGDGKAGVVLTHCYVILADSSLP